MVACGSASLHEQHQHVLSALQPNAPNRFYIQACELADWKLNTVRRLILISCLMHPAAHARGCTLIVARAEMIISKRKCTYSLSY